MKVFSPPKEIPLPVIDTTEGFDFEKLQKAEQDYVAKLADFARASGYVGKYTGEEFHIPWADGHARYMVIDAPRGFALIHLPLGDAWDVPAYMTRGVRKSDVIKAIKQNRKADELFKKQKRTRAEARI